MPDKNDLSTILSGAALVGTLFTGGIVFGDLRGEVSDNTDDIAEMRRDGRDTAALLTDIRLDVRDIKSKFEILVPTPDRQDAR